MLAEVRRLLHEEGYTIKGVQKLHRELGARRFLNGEGRAQEAGGAPPEAAAGAAAAERVELTPDQRDRLQAALAELEAAKARLDQLLRRR